MSSFSLAAFKELIDEPSFIAPTKKWQYDVLQFCYSCPVDIYHPTIFVQKKREVRVDETEFRIGNV
jgi:hypothetical protein